MRYLANLAIMGVVLGTLLNCSANTNTAPLSSAQINKIVKAIYVVEGGAKTKYPYGVRSIKTSNPRRVCENTVRNNYGRWLKAGAKGDFLEYLSEIYCPTKGKNLTKAEKECNKNWLPNLKRVLGVNSYPEGPRLQRRIGLLE